MERITEVDFLKIKEEFITLEKNNKAIIHQENSFKLPMIFCQSIRKLSCSAIRLLTVLSLKYSKDISDGRIASVLTTNICANRSDLRLQNLNRTFEEICSNNKIILIKTNDKVMSGELLFIVPFILSKQSHQKAIDFLSKILNKSTQDSKDLFYKNYPKEINDLY